MNGLKVLREVTSAEGFVLNSLAVEKELIEKDDGSKWVDNDHARDVDIARALGRTSGRFVVADEYNGFVAGPYRALDKAEAARSSAKMVVSAEVDVDDDLGPEDEPQVSAA